MIKPTLLLLGLSLCMMANSQSFTRIDEFTGTYQDDFEAYTPNVNVPSMSLIDGHALAEIQPWEGIPSGISVWPGMPTATSGTQVLILHLPSAGQIGLRFDEPMLRVGANWWVKEPRGDALNVTAWFYGPKAGGGEEYLGMEEFEQNSPDPLAPFWRGWESSSGITNIIFTSGDNQLLVDDMRITPVPEPGSMAVVGAGLLVALRKRRSS